MMQTLRTNMKAVFWIVIIAFLGTIFVVWGMKGEYAFRSPQTLAVVNGEELSYTEFYPIYKRQLEQYREIYKDKFTDDIANSIKEMLVNQMVMQKLILQQAKKMGVDVTIDEVVRKIKQYPAFQEKDGKFSEERLKYVLRNNHISIQEFEKDIKQSLIAEKIQGIIIDGTKVSDEEARLDYLANNEAIKAKYILIESAKFTDKNQAKTKADELKTKLNTGMSFETVANEVGGVKETEEFTNKQIVLVNIGNSPSFVKTAFSLKDNETSDVVETEKGYSILKVSTRKKPDESKFELEKENLKKNFLKTKTYLMFNEWLQEIKETNKTNIKILNENIKNI